MLRESSRGLGFGGHPRCPRHDFEGMLSGAFVSKSDAQEYAWLMGREVPDRVVEEAHAYQVSERSVSTALALILCGCGSGVNNRLHT